MSIVVLKIKHGSADTAARATTKLGEFKHYNKLTYTATLKVGKKKYKVKQDFQFFHNDPHLGRESEQIREEWYITTAQMRSIMETYPELILVKHLSTFDGMTDGTRTIEDEFGRPSPEWAEQIIEQLRNRGLMRCHYNSREQTFKLWSCVDNYEVKFAGEINFL